MYEEYASALAGKSWLVLWGLAQRFAHYISFADQKNTPVCLTFDPLRLQMTIIAQNDQNYLRMLDFRVKIIFELKMYQF